MLINPQEKELYDYIFNFIKSSPYSRLVFSCVPQNVICELIANSTGYIVHVLKEGSFDTPTESRFSRSIEIIKPIKN